MLEEERYDDDGFLEEQGKSNQRSTSYQSPSGVERVYYYHKHANNMVLGRLSQPNSGQTHAASDCER